MKREVKNVKTHLLPGEFGTAEVYWTTKKDGPMNIIGREFPIDPVLGFSKEAGDQERLANRGEFLKRIGIDPLMTAVPKLKHGAAIKFANEHNRFIEDLTCDGLLTDRRGFALTMTFADCPSVVLYDGDSRLLMVLHAGWKGIAAGIIENAVSTMHQFGAHRSRITAFIGPSIRRCCYEVGPEVATAVDGIPHEHAQKVYIDLPDIIMARLGARGIPPERVTATADCAKCAVDNKTGKPLYFSYRRDKKNDPLDAGMLVAWIS